MTFNEIMLNLNNVNVIRLSVEDTFWSLPFAKGKVRNAYKVQFGDMDFVFAKYCNVVFCYGLDGCTWRQCTDLDAVQRTVVFKCLEELRTYSTYFLPDSFFGVTKLQSILSTINYNTFEYVIDKPLSLLPDDCSYTVYDSGDGLELIECGGSYFLYSKEDRWIFEINDKALVNSFTSVHETLIRTENVLSTWLDKVNPTVHEEFIQLRKSNPNMDLISLLEKYGGN